jgi:hypothetical protein
VAQTDAERAAYARGYRAGAAGRPPEEATAAEVEEAPITAQKPRIGTSERAVMNVAKALGADKDPVQLMTLDFARVLGRRIDREGDGASLGLLRLWMDVTKRLHRPAGSAAAPTTAADGPAPRPLSKLDEFRARRNRPDGA